MEQKENVNCITNEQIVRIQKKLQREETEIDIPCFLSDFLNHLRDYGFVISSDMQEKFFQVAADAEINLLSFEEVYQALKLIVCKNQMEVKNFREIFLTYIKKEKRELPGKNGKDKKSEKKKKQPSKEELQLRESCQKTAYEQNRDRENSLNDQLKQEQEALNRVQEEYPKIQAFHPSKKQQNEIGQLKESIKQAGSTFQTAMKKLKGDGMESLQYLLKEEWKNEIHPITKDMEAVPLRLKELLELAFSGRKPELMMQIVEQLNKISKMVDTYEKKSRMSLITKESEIKKSIERLEANRIQTQHQIDSLLKEIERTQKEMKTALTAEEMNEEIVFMKENAMIHRKDFMTKGNAVQCLGDLGEIGEKEFKKLTEEEKLWIYSYIRKNANRFMTRMMKNINTNAKYKLDVKQTVRYACASGGIPMRLNYKMPKANKPKLVMFLDISGSCKKASEMMLVFMYYMKKVFTGGCKTYVFVNQLYDISEMMDTDDAEACVNAVLEKIPTRGVYSNYHEPLRYYYQEKMNELTKDSIVLFIGDARNNKNESGEIFIKAISRRVKRTYWMNTEEIARWSTGDSIMNVYEQYMNRSLEVLTPRQLLEFLLSIH